MSSTAEITAAETTEAQVAPVKETSRFAMLFQLEDVAVNGRQAAYHVLKDLLAKEKKDLPLHVFARYCIAASPEAYLPRLLEAVDSNKNADSAMAQGVQKDIVARLSQDAKPLPPAMVKLLTEARHREINVAVVSLLPEGVAQAIIEKIGLSKFNVQFHPFKNGDRSFPGPNTWLKIAKLIEKKPRNCAVVGATMQLCKASVSADMRCVGIPDEFTSFQDFGGVDVSLDQLEDMPPKELLTVLFPHSEK